jgi:hypothetical protein
MLIEALFHGESSMAAKNEKVLTTSCTALTQQKHAAVSETVPEKQSNVIASRSVMKDTDHRDLVDSTVARFRPATDFERNG